MIVCEHAGIAGPVKRTLSFILSPTHPSFSTTLLTFHEINWLWVTIISQFLLLLIFGFSLFSISVSISVTFAEEKKKRHLAFPISPLYSRHLDSREGFFTDLRVSNLPRAFSSGPSWDQKIGASLNFPHQIYSPLTAFLFEWEQWLHFLLY
uniref:Uncharacterized protein n=1 Tax=Opuntia streptacantha TaxID=393608 RepID=A0A7C8ZJE5_OPUST